MASLTVTATVTRRIIVLGGISLGVGLFLLISYNIGLAVYRTFFPPKPPSAFVAFGKLPSLELNEGVKPPKDITYRIETVTGDLEELALDLKVFAIEQPEVKFGDDSRVNTWASDLTFAVPAISKADGNATFAARDPNDKRLLKIGTTTQKGIIESDYVNDLNVISQRHDGEENALGEAKKIVRVFGLSEDNYPKDKIKFTNYKIDSGKLVKTSGISTTNLIQVDFFHSDIDKIPVVYPLSGKSKIWVLTSKDKAVAASIDITKIQLYKFSTYPLKGIKKAFEDLKAGKAIYNMQLSGNTFDIRDVVLGYLDKIAYQPYLQPVYIFRSNDGLEAYVPAVDESFSSGNALSYLLSK